MNDLKSLFRRFCVEIGSDPLMVQGAGGNASWKDGDTLWIKASGTWLADAESNEIFVPVDLGSLQAAISHGEFSAVPQLKHVSPMKPSIETILHASLQSKIVVHVHAIEVLAHLVKKDACKHLQTTLGGEFDFVAVDYFKPGFELAEAVNAALKKNPSARIVFLANHGLVVGGETVEEISLTLEKIVSVLHTPAVKPVFSSHLQYPDSEVDGYTPVIDKELHQLAFDARLFAMLESFWALYPDHVVFLGAKAQTFGSWSNFRQHIATVSELPELIFIQDQGVFTREEFGKAKLAQLRCYYDVISRQVDASELQPLSHEQVLDLLNWDAEKYRLLNSKM